MGFVHEPVEKDEAGVEPLVIEIEGVDVIFGKGKDTFGTFLPFLLQCCAHELRASCDQVLVDNKISRFVFSDADGDRSGGEGIAAWCC